MTDTERHLRSDALRNRRALLDAAAEVLCERGLDVPVTEIAQRAGVGRATLFRNFPSKQDLIAAIVVMRMQDAVRAGRELLLGPDHGEAVFGFIAEIFGRQQMDRALFEGVADAFLANAEIRAAYEEVIAVLDDLLAAAKEAGVVRPEIGALDVMMMVKGVCSAASALGEAPEVVDRHLDLVRAAISTPAHARPLRGSTPTLADLERAVIAGAGAPARDHTPPAA
jgi:AcrR family transcriptional regulator